MSGNRSRIEDTDFGIFEIPYVSRHQDSTARAGYGGKLAVGLADRPACATPVGHSFRISAGGGAVERQNPFTKAKIGPPGHGGLDHGASPAGRHDRDAIEQFRFADRRQKYPLRTLLCYPRRGRYGYYARDDPAHRDASAWAGKGAEALGLEGPVDPDTFKDVLAGEVPDGTGHRLGRKDREGNVHHRPGRDLTFSAPKSVSLAALIGGDRRIVAAHDEAVKRTFAWIERNVVETRMKDPETGCMVRAGNQKTVVATFRHETSRNLDPQLHTHAVLANMVQGGDGKWRAMANESLYRRQKPVGMVYRAELARELTELGYRIEKTHTDGRFEIAGVSRAVVEAFSTRRAEIEAAMEARGLGAPGADPRLAQRAALMTRAHKRDVDKEALRESWEKQAAGLGFDARTFAVKAMQRQAGRGAVRDAVASSDDRQGSGRAAEADRAAAWAVAHLAEREAVFSRTDLLATMLAWRPGAVAIDGAQQAVARLEKTGALHAANLPVPGDSLTTDKAVADEKETVALTHAGRDRGASVMRGRAVDKALRNGPLTAGQKDAVKLILFREGPDGGRPGLRGHRKDRDAEPRPRAPGEARVRGRGPRPVGLGRADP